VVSKKYIFTYTYFFTVIDMQLNASAITSYGNFTMSSLQQSLIDVNHPTSATFTNYGNLSLSSANITVQMGTAQFGNLTISSDSSLNIESDISFQNGSQANVGGMLTIADGAHLGIPVLAFLHLRFSFLKLYRKRFTCFLIWCWYARNRWYSHFFEWVFTCDRFCNYWQLRKSIPFCWF
jgi:hypothetical protein